MAVLVLMFLAAYVAICSMVAFLFGAFMQLSRTKAHQALDAHAQDQLADREASSYKVATRQAISA
jgi:hypothetical protein